MKFRSLLENIIVHLCDAGTVLKFHSFHVVLLLIDNSVQKILFESYDEEPFDTDFYYKSFSDVYKKNTNVKY